MFLLGVYDQTVSHCVGSETYERLTSQSFVADSIKQLRSTGPSTGASKTLLKVLLVSALSPMADAWGAHSTSMPPLAMFLFTLLVVAFSTILWLALRVYSLEGTLRMNRTLVDVLGVLQKNLKSPGAEVKGEDGESEIEDDDEFDETPRTRHRRYMDAEDMSHVSDPDEWCRLHYGVDEDSPRFQQQLDDMHAAHRARLHRLEAEWDEAELANDLDAKHSLEMQIIEVNALLPRT